MSLPGWMWVRSIIRFDLALTCVRLGRQVRSSLFALSAAYRRAPSAKEPPSGLTLWSGWRLQGYGAEALDVADGSDGWVQHAEQ